MRSFKIKNLVRSSNLTVTDFDCSGRACCAREEEAAPAYEIVLPISGMYLKRDSFGEVVIDPTCIAFFNKGQPFEIDHPSNEPDRCLILGLSDSLMTDFPAASLNTNLESDDRLFAHPVVRLSYEKWLAVWRIFYALIAPAHRCQEEDVELLYMLFDLVSPNTVTPSDKDRSNRSSLCNRRQREVVEETLIFLNENFQQQVKLSKLATEVASSPYHLCRTFKTYTGYTINQYLTRLRLSEALKLLRDPERSITSIAYEVGFASHSHFTSKFHEKFGSTPSFVRQGIGTVHASEANSGSF